MTTYVYIRSEPQVWTTGFYDPEGKWHADQDHKSPEEAAERVHWLNGGSQDLMPTLVSLETRLLGAIIFGEKPAPIGRVIRESSSNT